MEIETSNATITITKLDEENIVKGLATLIDIYADNLKELVNQSELHGTILKCESLAIDRCIEKIKSASDTLTYFCDEEN